MMNIEVRRYCFGDDSTLSRIFVNEHFLCFGLEDERRTVKVKGETCIPPGRYKIELRTEGGMHQRYAERFSELHRGMLWLQDVPNFTYIYFHIGNRESHTDGCILTGTEATILASGEFEVLRSTDAYLQLYRAVLDAMDAGEAVWVHVSESER